MVGVYRFVLLALKLERATFRGTVTTEGSRTSSTGYTMLCDCKKIEDHEMLSSSATLYCSEHASFTYRA